VTRLRVAGPQTELWAQLDRLFVMSRKKLASSLCWLPELQGFLPQSEPVLQRSVSFSKVSRAGLQPCAAHAAGASWSVSWRNSLRPREEEKDSDRTLAGHHLWRY
jgi:hypothetical protein